MRYNRFIMKDNFVIIAVVDCLHNIVYNNIVA